MIRTFNFRLCLLCIIQKLILSIRCLGLIINFSERVNSTRTCFIQIYRLIEREYFLILNKSIELYWQFWSVDMGLLLIHSILVSCSVWQINLNVIFIILTRLIMVVIALAIDHLLILLIGKYLLFINCIIAAILTLSSINCLLRCKHLILNILKCAN